MKMRISKIFDCEDYSVSKVMGTKIFDQIETHTENRKINPQGLGFLLIAQPTPEQIHVINGL